MDYYKKRKKIIPISIKNENNINKTFNIGGFKKQSYDISKNYNTYCKQNNITEKRKCTSQNEKINHSINNFANSNHIKNKYIIKKFFKFSETNNFNKLISVKLINKEEQLSNNDLVKSDLNVDNTKGFIVKIIKLPGKEEREKKIYYGSNTVPSKKKCCFNINNCRNLKKFNNSYQKITNTKLHNLISSIKHEDNNQLQKTSDYKIDKTFYYKNKTLPHKKGKKINLRKNKQEDIFDYIDNTPNIKNYLNDNYKVLNKDTIEEVDEHKEESEFHELTKNLMSENHKINNDVDCIMNEKTITMEFNSKTKLNDLSLNLKNTTSKNKVIGKTKSKF